MNAQNFNFALNFPKIGIFSPILHFKRKFCDKNIFSDSPKFRGGVGNCLPLATTPLMETGCSVGACHADSVEGFGDGCR